MPQHKAVCSRFTAATGLAAVAFCLVGAGLSACGSSSGVGAGRDAAVDGARDASVDSSVDSGASADSGIGVDSTIGVDGATDGGTGVDSRISTDSGVGNESGPDADAAGDGDVGTDGAGGEAGVPAPAAQAGYNVRTFGPAPTLGTTPGTLQLCGFYGAPAIGPATQNPDGSLYLAGSTSDGYQVCTASHNAAMPQKWQGMAFGGGYYAEAQLSFIPVASPGNPWPAFWANDIETMSQNAVTSANHWPGQASNYGDWIETDFFELDANNVAKYGIAAHNWYGIVGSRVSVSTTFGSVGIAPAVFSTPNTFGFLWVPATVTTQGSGKWFFNGTVVGTITWDLYDSDAAPPPEAGASAYNIMDSRHMALIFDTGPTCPMTIQSVSVWQANASSNLSYP